MINKAEIKNKTLQVNRTAHLFTLGNEEADVQWMITHGYAMTADQTIKKFRGMDLKRNYFVSAEALSSFYWRDAKGEIPVASWMTSRFRLDEIEDYSNYLDQVYSTLRIGSKKVLFGFSQGGTTLFRYINAKKPDFDLFINWSGDIPLNSEYDTDYLRDRRFLYVYGDRDQYMDENLFNKRKTFAEELGLNVHYVKYQGDHRIFSEVLEALDLGL